MPIDTSERDRKVLEIYSRTLNTKATAQELGCTMAQVRSALKKEGIPLHRGRSVCYDHIDEIRQWVSEGVMIIDMARRIGTKHGTVRAFLDRHGIPYERQWRKLDNHPRWKGGRIIDQDGYVLVKCPDHPNNDRQNYGREHRLVMEQTLGRYLDPQEVVHHKDGDKQNNHPDNLEVFGSNREHLAATLVGQVPNWTPEGMERIREGVRRPRGKKRKSTP